MKRQTRVLQQRIEIAAFQRGRKDTIERIGRQQHEQQEADRNQALDRQRTGLQAGRKIAAEHRDQRTEQRHHRDP